jgi:hypothetical protein
MAGLADPGAMEGFVEAFGITFPQVVSPDGRLWARFAIPVQGAWYFLNQDGTGEAVPYDLTGAELTERLDDLLAR